jgi:drug/metabolite transporter (DMT)-like permease
VNVWLGLFLTVLSWAITFHLGRYVVTMLPPNSVAIWRFVVGSLLLIPVVSLREQWDWRGLWRHRWALLALGGLGIGGFQLGMFYGLQTSTASNAALLMAVSPALTVALAAVVDRRWIGWPRVCGVVIGFIGVVIVATKGDWQVLRGMHFARGDLYLCTGGAMWAVYSVGLQRWIKGLSNLQVTVSTLVICAVVIAILAILANPASLRWPPPRAGLPLLFMGFAASALAYIWWNNAVIKVGAGRAASFMNLIPVLTMLIAVLLGESLSLAQLSGGALVVAGVLLATRATL